MNKYVFFTGAFKVLDDGGLSVCHRIHCPDDVYDDDVQGWLTADEIIAEWV